MVHVNHGHVRAPSDEDRLRIGQLARCAYLEDTMVQRQFDEIDDELAVMKDERTSCFDPDPSTAPAFTGHPRLTGSCLHLLTPQAALPVTRSEPTPPWTSISTLFVAVAKPGDS